MEVRARAARFAWAPPRKVQEVRRSAGRSDYRPEPPDRRNGIGSPAESISSRFPNSSLRGAKRDGSRAARSARDPSGALHRGAEIVPTRTATLPCRAGSGASDAVNRRGGGDSGAFHRGGVAPVHSARELQSARRPGRYYKILQRKEISGLRHHMRPASAPIRGRTGTLCAPPWSHWDSIETMRRQSLGKKSMGRA